MPPRPKHYAGVGLRNLSPTYKITATVSGATRTVASFDGYQVFGPPAYLSYGNGLWRSTNYDTDRRVTGISTSAANGPIQSLTYGFDTADHITAITNGVDAGQTQQYQYDGASRLTQAALAGGNVASFGYDAVSNRITQTTTAPATRTAYAIATGSNRMTQSSMAGVTRSVTTNGVGDVTAFINTAGTANTLAYDPFGRLASHTKSGVTTSYTVNALDQRMAKANASSSSRYVYAGFNQLLAEQTNGQWSSYIYNGSEPVALVRNNQIYYLHNDHLGRPQLATNSSQQVVWKAANTAFDRTVTQDSIGGLSLGFPGQYLDAESGIWHNGYREYWAETGRYLQSDPIGLAGGVNTFAYVGGNPVSWIDSLGLQSKTNDWVNRQIQGDPDQNGLGAAVTRDSLRAWIGAYMGFPSYAGESGLRIGTCVLKCAANEFIGSSVKEIVINAHEKAVEKAVEDGSKAIGSKCLSKAVGVYGVSTGAMDAAKTMACSLECK